MPPPYIVPSLPKPLCVFLFLKKECLNPPRAICAIHILWEVWHPTEECSDHHGRILKKTGLSLSQQPTACTSLLHAGVLSVLSVQTYCTFNYFDFLCAAAHCIQKAWFPCRHPLPQTVTLFSVPSSWALGEGLGIDVPFRVKHPVVSYLLPLNQFCVFVFIYCQRMLFWLGLKGALIYRYTSKSLRVSLIHDVCLTESQ